jgi:hypothetical protein
MSAVAIRFDQHLDPHLDPRLDPRLESAAPSGGMLRDAVAAARETVWSHPALKRLQDPGLGFD